MRSRNKNAVNESKLRQKNSRPKPQANQVAPITGTSAGVAPVRSAPSQKQSIVCKSILGCIMSKDYFGDSYTMKIDDGEESLHSLMGSLCSLMIFFLVVLYSYQKVDILWNKKDVDVLSTTNDMHFETDYVFDY